jgi:hypothetical protein
MNLIALLNRTRRLPLDQRYAALISAKPHFKPRSVDMAHLIYELERVQFRRIRRELRRESKEDAA